MPPPVLDVVKAQRRMDRAKRKGRPEVPLDRWTRCAYWNRPADAWELDPDRDAAGSPLVERIDYAEVSEAEFIERFERPGRPCIIKGVFETENCPAAHGSWGIEKLVERFGEAKVKVGEDDDGYKVMVKLKYFLHYIHAGDGIRDDSPLYVFDSSFSDNDLKKELDVDYVLPKYFRDDLFKLAGERRRPPYKWFLVGSLRSGTGMHIDPLGTSAWNTLVSGRKRWTIFPPRTPKEALQTPRGIDSEAISWIEHVLPKARAADWPHHPPIEFVQHPGETVFVPGGWHHTVLNLETCVAVTQNFCSKVNFRLVWPRTRRGRPKMAQKMLTKLEEQYPDLVKLANSLDINARDELPSDSSSDSSSSSSSSSESEDEPADLVQKRRKVSTKTADAPK